MPSTGNLQSSRFEFKYIVDESTAGEIHRFIGNYVEPDAHTVGKEGRGYPVHSLYLDSTNFLTCRATLHGDKNRFKLRARFYDDNPDTPVFLEIKARVSLIIQKKQRPRSGDRALGGCYAANGWTPTICSRMTSRTVKRCSSSARSPGASTLERPLTRLTCAKATSLVKATFIV